MGAEESGAQAGNFIDYRPYNQSGDYSNITRSTSSSLVEEESNNKMMKTPFSGVWKRKHVSFMPPHARSDSAYAYSAKNEKLFIAFGETFGNEQMNDVWSYDMKNDKWQCLSRGMIQARSHSSGVIIDDQFYVFGGQIHQKFTNELLKIDTNTGDCQILKSSGTIPTPRSSAVIGTYQNNIFIWGGNGDQHITDELFIYNIQNRNWTSVHTGVAPRSEPGFVSVDKYIFVNGSSDEHGDMIRINMEERTATTLVTTGTHPAFTAKKPTLVRAGSFIFVFGGTNSSHHYTSLFGFNVLTNKWMMLYFSPDDESTYLEDGEVTATGLFQIPRESGCSSFFHGPTRSIVYTMGSLLKEGSPIYTIEIGDMLSFLNHREDMLSMIRF